MSQKPLKDRYDNLQRMVRTLELLLDYAIDEGKVQKLQLFVYLLEMARQELTEIVDGGPGYDEYPAEHEINKNLH